MVFPLNLPRGAISAGEQTNLPSAPSLKPDMVTPSGLSLSDRILLALPGGMSIWSARKVAEARKNGGKPTSVLGDVMADTGEVIDGVGDGFDAAVSGVRGAFSGASRLMQWAPYIAVGVAAAWSIGQVRK